MSLPDDAKSVMILTPINPNKTEKGTQVLVAVGMNLIKICFFVSPHANDPTKVFVENDRHGSNGYLVDADNVFNRWSTSYRVVDGMVAISQAAKDRRAKPAEPEPDVEPEKTAASQEKPWDRDPEPFWVAEQLLSLSHRAEQAMLEVDAELISLERAAHRMVKDIQMTSLAIRSATNADNTKPF